MIQEFLSVANLWLPGVLAMSALIVVSGFFSSSETALFYLSHDELRSFRTGNRRERVIARLLGEPDRLLSAILFWNLVINLLYFAVSVIVSAKLASENQSVAAAMFSIFSVFGIIIMGEVMPKSLAVLFPRKLANIVCWPLAIAVSVLDPITPRLRKLTSALQRVFWPNLERETIIDADDLERAVEASKLGDEIKRQERVVLHTILDLSEISAEEVMRPRGTYTRMSTPISLPKLQGRIPPGGFLVLKAKDGAPERAILLSHRTAIPVHHLEQLAEPMIYVPWCANAAGILELLRRTLGRIASVVDEYGETIGVITYEDILETLLLPESSRAKRVLQREPVLEIAPDRYHVESMTTLRYLCKRLDLPFDAEEQALLTVGGMVNDELEELPVVGSECTWMGYRFRVIQVTQPGRFRAMVFRDDSEGAEA